MSRDYDFVSFDCYGTLVDWESGIAGSFASMAQQGGHEIPPREAILEAHARHEPVVQAESFRSYRDVLTETAKRMGQEFGWKLPDATAAQLAESLPDWPVFPDTNPSLRRLREAGYQLGILSNVDDDLLCRTIANLDVGFDTLVTAEQVRAYKPAPPHFEHAAQRIGSSRWLHVAQSWFHDIVPAKRHGVPSMWINRHRETPGDDGAPLAEFVDLIGLADRLA